MTITPLMPMATAVWLVENTTLTFKQIAKFCNLHEIEVQGIADGEVAKGIKPSLRGELEITDINKEYLKQGRLNVELFDRGTAWLDTGTVHSLLDAANFIKVLQDRQGLKIGCPEEVAYRNGLIDSGQLIELASGLGNSLYGQYLREILDKQ